MTSAASFRSSTSTTRDCTAPLVWAVFFALGNLARSASRTPGITSSTTRMVVRSRQVWSLACPVFVRVVTPRITQQLPPTRSTGVTPPRISASTSLSSNRFSKAEMPCNSAPPKGSAGSLPPQMAPATAAATHAPPASCETAGATKTTRSLFSSPARLTSASAVSPAAPATTAMRSLRSAEALITLSRSFCCTASFSLSQTTTFTPSCSCTRANAASYPFSFATGTASTRAAPLASKSFTSAVSPSSAPKVSAVCR